ncbi:MAG: hypothetical protein K2X43_00140 [Hyphomonadaceae bacterium]|nr:hypothetical protein [Hyphomonadaceae bacterium]
MLANLVKLSIDGYRGPMTSEESPPVTIRVQGVFQENERSMSCRRHWPSCQKPRARMH